MQATTSDGSFHALGLDKRILEVVDRLAFTTPTPIQDRAIPLALTGQDMIGLAQTGTGKTLAFGLPLIQKLLDGKGRALVVLPTRELALQVDETLQKLGRPLGLRTVVLMGGVPIQRQLRDLEYKPRIIVATPGRLIDHLESGSIELGNVEIFVLDEADRMFDMGFAPQITRILAALPYERQTLLFSATMPREIEELARAAMRSPLRVEVARVGMAAEGVTQEMFVVPSDQKLPLLEKLLAETEGTVLVFSRTKHGAKRLTSQLMDSGHKVAEIHANRSLAQRKAALSGFKTGVHRILVATDIAARGIDVQDIQLVVNYDLPDVPEEYVHRIGRTGRAGKLGRAVSFAVLDQGHEVQAIERVLGRPIPRGVGSEDVNLTVLSRNELREKRRERDGVRGQRSSGGGRGGDRQQGSRGNERPREAMADQAPRENRSFDRPRENLSTRSPHPTSNSSSSHNAPGTRSDSGYSSDRRPSSSGDRPYRRDGDRSRSSSVEVPQISSVPKGFNGPRKAKRR